MSNESSEQISNWEKRQEFYTVVGQGISFWANMETELVRICALLLRSSNQKTGLVLYSIMNFNTWLSIISDLFAADKTYNPLAKKWNKLAESLREKNDIRVRLAHHTRFASAPDEISLRPGRFDTRPKSQKAAPLTFEEIDAFGTFVVEFHPKLFGLAEEMLLLPHIAE